MFNAIVILDQTVILLSLGPVVMPINKLLEECVSLKAEFKYIKFGNLIEILNGSFYILCNSLTL